MGRPPSHVLLVSWLAAGCGDPGKLGETAQAFWPLDFEAEYAEVRDCRLSPAAHDGFYIRVFANAEAEEAYLNGEYPFAPGAQLVKGEYDDDECSALERASGMLKREPGSDPELGDWRWQRAKASGELMATPAPRSCAGCHESCESRDYACTDP
jgi:hypothetical protein